MANKRKDFKKRSQNGKRCESFNQRFTMQKVRNVERLDWKKAKAKSRYPKNWPVKGFCGQKQSVKLLQNNVFNTTQHPLSHTLSVYNVLW